MLMQNLFCFVVDGMAVEHRVDFISLFDIGSDAYALYGLRIVCACLFCIYTKLNEKRNVIVIYIYIYKYICSIYVCALFV